MSFIISILTFLFFIACLNDVKNRFFPEYQSYKYVSVAAFIGAMILSWTVPYLVILFITIYYILIPRKRGKI